jgi:cell division protein FtsI (penicillin-binding protein 3)
MPDLDTSATPSPALPPPLTAAQEERLHQKMSRKIKAILIVCLLAFVVVAVKLFLIQITYGDMYSSIARRQYESKVILTAERGNIYDRKRRLIVTTVQKLSLAVDPHLVQNSTRIAKTLSSVTNTPSKEYVERIRKSRTSFVWLERTIDAPSSALQTSLDSLEDNGLIKIREPRRSFAYASLAAQILGFTDAENKGASGIELGWDSVLAGKSGFMILQRDGRGRKRPSPDLPSRQPQTGNSLVLTLDMDMQGIAESELQQGVQAAAAESGMVIAVKPSTGEILAMASLPTFNPNNLSSATADVTRNRCFTDMYEPGSTFKLISAAALVDEGKINPDDMVNGGSDQLPRGVAIKDEHPVGMVPFTKAMELSSNIVVAALSQRLANAKFYKYVRDFGFGIYAGIDVPGEVRGMVKKPQEFDATTKLYMAHGYQLAATPLQIVNAYAAVANGGMMMKPFVVQRVINPNGEDVHITEPQKVRRVIGEESAAKLTRIFCSVVERGTGSSARIEGMAIAGKTGTAQKLRDGKYSKEDYTASFAGFFPADKPEVAMLVMLNNPRNGYYGSQVAAPIFQRIAQKFVSSGLVSPGGGVPALSNTTSPKAPSKPEERIVPDVRGLTLVAAKELAKESGFTVKTTASSGVVQTQKPKAGTAAQTTTEIVVSTTQPDITVDALPNTTIPDVRGMTLRRALTLLHAANIKTKVLGQGGTVYKQEFRDGKEPLCILDCRPPE